MPDMTSSDFTTLMMFFAALATVILLVGLRYTYLLRQQEQASHEPCVVVQRWLCCDKCGTSTAPTALYNDCDNPFRIRSLCTYCALCSEVEPFVLFDDEEEEHAL